MTKARLFLKEGPQQLHESTLRVRSLSILRQSSRAGKPAGKSSLTPFTERTLSTAEKLGDVVPKIIGIESPKGVAVWQRFRELEKIRDEVVHLKNQTLVSSETENESRVLFQLLETDNRIWPQNALKLLLTYFISDQLPRWVKALQSRISI